MELRNLKTFIHVAQTGSFSKTAEQLDYAQSTISAQISSLEDELQVSLFIRHGKKFTLSSEGEQLLGYAYQLVELESEAGALFHDVEKPKGLLKIGVLESISASHYSTIILQHLEKYPAVKLHVTVGTTLQLMDLLEKGRIDIIITLDVPIKNPKFKQLSSKQVPIHFFCHKQNKIASLKKPMLHDLMNERFLLTEKGCNYRQVFEEILYTNNLKINDFLEIGYTQIILDAVKANLGVSLLPEFNLKNIASDITIINVEDCKLALFLQILILDKQWLSPLKRNFIVLFDRLEIER